MVPVVANAPVLLTVKGQQLMVPLSALVFNEKGQPRADGWPRYAEHSAAVDVLLARLVKHGVLRAGAQPARPALIATAVAPGAGVDIEIEIANVAPNAAAPASSTADFKVTETETYAAVEPAKLKALVGEAAGAGAKPGLVFVSSAGEPVLPKSGAYDLAGDPATVTIANAAGDADAFALQSRGGGADAALTKVEIKDVAPADGGRFTMIVRWSKSVAAVALTDVAAQFAYCVTVAAPDGGFRAPVAGTIRLAGGADAVTINPVKSSGVVPAQ